jgi:inner membrane protein import complex subunit Tim44-like protein
MGTRWQIALLVLVVAAILIVSPDAALAGPGGKIASGLAKTFWGKVVLGALAIVLFPVIVWVMVQEHRASKRAMRDLARLRALDPAFDWLTLKDRVTECFHRVHAAWRKEDMAQAADWMTEWYWQNQQLAHLNRWAEQGLVNHCTVKSVGRVRPLFLACREDDGDFSGSRLVVSITAKMEDYLQDRSSGKVVEGKKGYADTETVWTFALKRGLWRVAAIEDDSVTLMYARMANELPALMPEVKPASAARGI